MDTKTNPGMAVGARKFNGQFFGFATYAEKAETIHGNKAEFATLAAAMSDSDLDAALLEVKTIARRLEDPEEVLAGEMKARAALGAEFDHFKLETYERAGSTDWTAIGAALGLTKTQARAKFAGTVKVTSLKPKA